MRAAVLHPGGAFSIDERELPTPGPGEICVESMVVGICGSDLHYFHDGHIGDWWVRQPHVLGHEFAGVVAAVGTGVTEPVVGDRVAIEPIIPCRECDSCERGLYNLCTSFSFTGSPHTDGGLQHFVVVPADSAHRLPADMSFAQGALVEPTSIAVHAIRRSRLDKGESVLIVGAGPIGLLVAAVAKAKGASSVTITDINTTRLAAATRLGVTEAIDVSDLSDEDLRKKVNPSGADVVFEAVGQARTYATALEVVRPGGRIVAVGVNADEVIPFNLMLAQAKEATLIPVYLGRNAFPEAIELLADGLIDSEALISHRFPLDKTDEAMATASGDSATGSASSAIKVLIEPPNLSSSEGDS